MKPWKVQLSSRWTLLVKRTSVEALIIGCLKICIFFLLKSFRYIRESESFKTHVFESINNEKMVCAWGRVVCSTIIFS